MYISGYGKTVCCHYGKILLFLVNNDVVFVYLNLKYYCHGK